MDGVLQKLITNKTPFYILGDLNVNIDKHKKVPQTLKYLNTLLSYSAYPIISFPT